MDSTITSAFKQFADRYLQANSATIDQHKAISCIKACKTGELGYNIQTCEDCATVYTHYNSCGNRHCPNCQAVNTEKWMMQRKNDILPVKYHHTVFTVPAELRMLFKYNKRLLYNLIFKVAWKTIETFSVNPKNRIQAEMGMIAILHTWKQNLEYHPHLHCIIPAGGITPNNKWKASPDNGNYLFNVEALADVFRGKFIHYLKIYQKEGWLNYWKLKHSAGEYFYMLKEKLYNKKWMVYSKESFKNQKSVFEYMARYTHKIAISNHRIKKITEKTVTFSYTDRAENYKTKTRTVDGDHFIKLFLQHVLPGRFMKIRNYGFLSSRKKNSRLSKLFEYFNLGKYEKPVKLTNIQYLERIYGIKPNICRICGGKLITIQLKERPHARDSPKNTA